MDIKNIMMRPLALLKEENMIKISESAEKIQESLVVHRRQLHQNPEIGVDLPKTVAYVKNELIKLGYEPEMCGGGIVATCGTGETGKTFLIRADMDALPIKEESGEAFSSANGNMHACGHDFHTSMLLGSAELLKMHEHQIKGTVKLMFQPAEELAVGAKGMIEAGVLKNPDVDAAMMMHVFSGIPSDKDGQFVVLADGPASANIDVFRINVKGVGGHGARPHETVDPINVCAHIHTALQILNAREVDANEMFILTIGEFKCGDTFNVIPDSGYMRGTIRSYGKEMRAFLRKRLVEISESVAKTYRAEAEVVFEFEAPSVINDLKLRNDFMRYVDEIMTDNVEDAKEAYDGKFARLTGSEDFGFVSEEVPTLMVGLIAGTLADGYHYPLHHPRVRFNEDVLWKGAATYAYVAMAWLNEN